MPAPADYWVKLHDPYPEDRIRVHYVEMAAMVAECGTATADACTARGDICDIYIWQYAKERACHLAHEKRHCAGWSHPKYQFTEASICG